MNNKNAGEFCGHRKRRGTRKERGREGQTLS